MRDSHNFLSDSFWRQDKVDASAGNCAFRHVWLFRRIKSLGNGDAAYVLNATQCRSPVAVVARDNNSDKLAISVFSQ